MPRIIYLGLQAFANTPQRLLPSAQNPLVCEALQETSLQEADVITLPQLDNADANHIGHWLNQSLDNQMFVAWPQPQPWLAACLAAGSGAEETLVAWQQQAKRLLALFRSARRQVRLVGYVPGCTLETIDAPEMAEPVAPVYQLAAAQLVSQHSDFLETRDYLTASSTENQTLPQDTQELVNHVLEHHRQYHQRLQNAASERDNQQQTIARLQGELGGAKDEYAHCLEQLHSVQKALEERTHQQSQLQQHLEQEQAKLAKTLNLVQQTNAERDHQGQEMARLKGELSAAYDEQALLLQQLQDVKQSIAERPSKEQVKELEDKNTLLLSQLHGVQTSLEKTLNDKQQASEKYQSDVNQHLKTIKTLQAECDTSSKTQQTLKKEKEALKKALETQQKEQQPILQTLQEAQTENVRLLETLHQVQQAYEMLEQQQEALIKHKEANVSQPKELGNTRQLQMLLENTQHNIQHLERLVQWLRVHAQRHAAAAYREIRSYKKTLSKQAAMLEASQFFDADWYCEQYPDVAQSGIRPAEHFIKFGAIDGRDPSPLFNTGFYLTHYEDVAASGQHPLLHYLRHGITEQREIRPAQYHLPAPKSPEEGKQ